MKQPVERRLAAILAADVAGYSRLMGADEEGTLERLKAHRRGLVDPKIKEHRGRIVKTTGDGMLVEFPSVVDAVRCAVEIQRGMVDRNAGMAEDKRITSRIGINLGDIIVDGDDIYGDGVNIAARLEALAEPGGICISRTVRNQIRDKLPYNFDDTGEQSVKNIARPVRVDAMSAAAVAATPFVPVRARPEPSGHTPFPRRAIIVTGIATALAIGIAAWWVWPQRPSSPVSVQAPVATTSQPAPSVATARAPHLSFVVLPFANLSNDPEQEYFADGITDDLTTDLTRISGSFVIARNTAFTYKGKSADVKQIGHDLGVRYVIEGSVRRSNEQVQVNVQLIDAENGAHFWADRFDTDRANLDKAQSEIIGRLATSLHFRLIEAEGRRGEQEKNPDARDMVMRGWAWYYRPVTEASLQEAQRAFEQARELDSESIDARIGLATVLGDFVTLGLARSPEQNNARSEQLLREVFERDQSQPRAYFAAGRLRRLQNRLIESQFELEKAVALDRNYAGAFLQLGITTKFLAQPERALPYLEKAIELNPRQGNMVYYHWWLGMAHILVPGHNDQAIEYLGKARADSPRFWWTHLYLAAALGLRGDVDEAKAALTESIKLKPEINSLKSLQAFVARRPWETNPQYVALVKKTIHVGLRRAGLPDE